MRTSDLLRLAFVFLKRRKSRTFLTVLGVVVGTVCIVLMLSIGYSNYSQFAQMFEGNSALTEIRLSSTGSETPGSELNDSALDSVAAIPHVAAVTPLIDIPCTIRTGAYEYRGSVTGADPAALMLDFEEGDVYPSDSASPVLVVGGDARRQFTDPASPPDFNDWEAYEAYLPEIDWSGANFELQFGYERDEDSENSLPEGSIVPASVSGVTKAEGSDASSIFMNLENAKCLILENAELAESLGVRPGVYQQALVRVDSMENVEEVLEAVRPLGFEAYSETEYIEDMREEQGRQQMQLLSIGLISLSISAIGIANTMYAGILERRRDIGVMKVLGMRIRRIRSLFLMESVIIGLLGGLCGLGVSAVVILAMNSGMQQGSFLGMYFAEGASITIPFWVATGAVGAALFTGILAGLWPAWKAYRMSALEAMRPGS